MTQEQIGEHILNGCLMTSTPQEVGEHLTKICVDESYMEDWFINSNANENPHWTLNHISELFEDFYLIPKTKED